MKQDVLSNLVCFPLPSSAPHKKLTNIDLSLFNTDSGNCKHDIIYVGKACKTGFINISLPAIERILLLLLADLLWNLSMS